MKKLTKKTPLNTIVKLNLPKEYHHQYPFRPEEHLLYWGMIPQMPGHCVVVNQVGRVFWGIHTESLCIVPDEEV